MIQYKKEDKQYYLRDNGGGTFMKIEKPLELVRGYIISFADSNMAISLSMEKTIELHFLDGPKADQKL
jgi:hypothetical protein